MNLALPRSLHYETHLGNGVHAHPREGPETD